MVTHLFKVICCDKNLLFYMMCGSVAEWSKALVLGTSLSGDVGSNPTTAINIFWC